MTKTLDLGCGLNPQNPYDADHIYGIDFIREASLQGDIVEIKRADLAVSQIPYPDHFFNYVTAFDFIEHVPRIVYLDGIPRLSFVELMSEVYRVLKVGGYFYSFTPAYPSKKAFQDPTHVNIITEDTFPSYFCGAAPWARSYGFAGNFQLISQEWIDGTHLSCRMQKL